MHERQQVFRIELRPARPLSRRLPRLQRLGFGERTGRALKFESGQAQFSECRQAVGVTSPKLQGTPKTRHSLPEEASLPLRPCEHSSCLGALRVCLDPGCRQLPERRPFRPCFEYFRLETQDRFVGRRQSGGILQDALGLVEAAGVKTGSGPLEEDRGIIRPEFCRPAIVHRRIGKSLQAHHQFAEPVPDPPELRLIRSNARDDVHGLVEPALLREQLREIHANRGVRRRNFDRPA